MKRSILLLLLLLPVLLPAQNRLGDHNTISWLTTTITPTLSPTVSLHLEYQWRRTNLVSDWQQSLLRVGVNYKANQQVTLHAGYGWIETFAYGDYNLSAVPKQFPEHRIYEQITVSTPVGNTNLQHRLRLEQRWLGRYNSMQSESIDEYIYLNRIRYMPRIDIPIYKNLYLAAFDEVFIGFGKNVGENVFDQNRIGVLAGYKANKTIRLEAGFLNQTVQLGREINNQNVFQYNNGFILNTFINL